MREAGLIKSETLAYYMVRAFLFLTACGINQSGIRFRQHRAKEMAHYAKDCWDAEVETSYGWIEVGGHADRAAFDLERHQKASKTELMAARPLKAPIQVKSVVCTLDKKIGGKEFKKDWKDVCEFVEALEEADKVQMMAKMKEENCLTIDCAGK